jgi:hypothetical protein
MAWPAACKPSLKSSPTSRRISWGTRTQAACTRGHAFSETNLSLPVSHSSLFTSKSLFLPSKEVAHNAMQPPRQHLSENQNGTRLGPKGPLLRVEKEILSCKQYLISEQESSCKKEHTRRWANGKLSHVAQMELFTGYNPATRKLEMRGTGTCRRQSTISATRPALRPRLEADQLPELETEAREEEMTEIVN